MKAKKDNKFPGTSDVIGSDQSNVPSPQNFLQLYANSATVKETSMDDMNRNVFDTFASDIAKPLTQLRNIPGPPPCSP